MCSQHLSYPRIARQRRRGLSLLEVILAIAILGVALVLIAELIRIGARSADRAKQISMAQIVCDTKMAELSAGVLPLATTSSTQIEEAPGWFYAVDVQSADQIGLLRVLVTINTAESIDTGVNLFSLTRLLPDPNYDPYEPEQTR